MLLGSGHHRKNESCYWLPPSPILQPIPTPTPQPPISFPAVADPHCTPPCPPPFSCLFAHPSIHPSIWNWCCSLPPCVAPDLKVTSDKIQERPGMRPALRAAYQIPAWLVRMMEEGGGWGICGCGRVAAEGELGRGGEGRGGSCHEKPRHSSVWNLFLAA